MAEKPKKQMPQPLLMNEKAWRRARLLINRRWRKTLKAHRATEQGT